MWNHLYRLPEILADPLPLDHGLIYFASAQIALLRQTYFVRWVGGFVGLSVSIDNGKERNAEMGENFYLTLKKRS
jgi:hypothetical protein